MNIAIVDDSNIDLEILQGFAAQYCSDSRLYASIHTFRDSSGFLDSFAPDIYDLIFLDIYIDDMNGISLAKEIRKSDSNCCIVFSTSSADFAVEGFQVRAFDYMLKPISYGRFQETCDLCLEELPERKYYIEVKEGRVYTKILVSDILYTDYYNHYIQIHTTDSMIRSYMSFSEFEPMLADYPQFLCCCRNCTVNLDKVVDVKDRSIILNNGEHVPISAKLKKEVHSKYRDYTFHKKLI